MATCLALGGALLALRAGGVQVGWAFQLQDPRVILFLTLLATAITLNLVGLFHLRSFGGGEALAGKGGAAGSFWTGVLAAFVATPCTGPFMAAALGAALVLPVPAALAIFAGLGLGLALPFLGLGFIPALRRMMPKPGAWMATFQRILAIPMALTVAALLWLLWRQTGLTGLKIGSAGALLVTLLGWLAGRRQPLGLSLLPAFGALAVVAAVAMPFLFTLAPTHSSVAAGTEPFSETRLVALRQANKPVFLYFTADWCLTCKVNEKAAIDRAETRAAFKKAGVTVMVGDWTNGDPAITRFLEARGRSGVPLYLWYPKGGGEPTELPQVLTPGTLTALVS
jgi:thiol:disulfide interchange protein